MLNSKLLSRLIAFAGGLVVCLSVSGRCSAEGPVNSAPRTKEYPWMSVARWKEMHEGFLKRGKEGPVDILFLGDSITEGWYGAGGPVWNKEYKERKAANFGIGGDMTQNVLWRITEGGELAGLAPKVVVLMIGTNNFGLGGHKPDDVAKGVTAVVETLRKKLPESRVLLLGVFPRDAKPGTGMRKNIAALNEKIAKLDDGKSVKYLDIGGKFLAEDGSLPKDVMPDFLHLSAKGYQIWADAIRGPLEEMTK